MLCLTVGLRWQKRAEELLLLGDWGGDKAELLNCTQYVNPHSSFRFDLQFLLENRGDHVFEWDMYTVGHPALEKPLDNRSHTGDSVRQKFLSDESIYYNDHL